VNVSVANTRLFLGNIPKSKSKDEILEELRKHTGNFGAMGAKRKLFEKIHLHDGVFAKLVFSISENVVEVIIYSNPDSHDGRKNRGFCFVDFTDHKAASDAKFVITFHTKIYCLF
jgi:RNA recognition motif-containing protein